MEIRHRLNSEERQHYLFEQRYSFKVKPRLLYVGKLKNNGFWSETDHNLDFVEILLVKSGKGSVEIEGEDKKIKKGDIIIYNAGTTHRETGDAEKPLNLYFMALCKLSITDLPENYLLPPGYPNYYAAGEDFDIFCTMFEVMIKEFDKKEQFYAEIAQNISRTFLMYLFRIINSTEDKKQELHSNRAIIRAIEFINENYHREFSLDEIAEYCYVNKYYLSHLFPAHKHMTLKQYLISKRIEEAKKLLCQEELSVGEIAERAGVPDSTYFSRLFKRETGESPLAYRKRVKEQNRI